MCDLVSIIINCHNGADTLSACFDSVLAQSYTAWEVIFFDSASDDASLAMAQSYAAKYPQIRCIAHVSKPILGEARNLALAHARGAYIAFLDVDDVWLAQKLQLQVRCLQENPLVDVLCTDAELFDDIPPWWSHLVAKRTRRVFARSHPARGAVFEELIQRQWFTLSSVMLRRSALQKQGIMHLEHSFDPCLQLAADADLFYRMAAHGQCDFIDAVLTRRRVHTGSITLSQWEKWPKEIQYILDKFRKIWPDFDARFPLASESLQRRIVFQQAIALWRQGNGVAARRKAYELIYTQKKGHGLLHGKSMLLYLLSFFPSRFFSAAAHVYTYLPRFLLS